MKESITLATCNHKTAALYCDKVVPVLDFWSEPDKREAVDTNEYSTVFKELSPEQGNQHITAYYTSTVLLSMTEAIFASAGTSIRHSTLADVRRGLHEATNVNDAKKTKILVGLDTLIRVFGEQRSFRECYREAFGALTRNFAIEGIIMGDDGPGVGDKVKSPGCFLANLDLVDVSATEWKHILEFRKDTEARSKLQNLRTFIYKNNMMDHAPWIIKDDIASIINEYNAAVKKWGFVTKIATLGCFFTLGGFDAANAVTQQLMGAQLNLVILKDMLIGVGSVSLSIASALVARWQIETKYPAAYLFDVSSLLGAKPNFPK